MRAVVVVVDQPLIQIDLQFFDRAVDLAPECDLVKLLQDRLVKALANTVGLRMTDLGLRVLDVIQGQVELIVVRFRPAAVFRAAIGQHPDQPHALFLQEGQYPVIQHIGGSNRRLRGVELGCRPFRVGIDEGLLVNASHALDGEVAPEIRTVE